MGKHVEENSGGLFYSTISTFEGMTEKKLQ
jgi:hypothetical protein